MPTRANTKGAAAHAPRPRVTWQRVHSSSCRLAVGEYGSLTRRGVPHLHRLVIARRGEPVPVRKAKFRQFGFR